jgi:predicted lactoylglutathione lyase
MSPLPSRKVFVNLAVHDLARSVEFFTQLGFRFDPRFTDENATCMILSDEAFVMLLDDDFFKTFTKKDLCDPTTQVEAILALSADSRAEVDDIVDTALAAGGRPSSIWTRPRSGSSRGAAGGQRQPGGRHPADPCAESLGSGPCAPAWPGPVCS